MRCYRITNSDGKVWVMPTRSLRVAMALYQPSGWKGRLLKSAFPWLHWSGVVRKFAHAAVVDEELPASLKAICEQCFPGYDLQYSLFLGTPSVHQKTTIQVYARQTILGYCKVSTKEDVARLFDTEEVVLQQLEQLGIKGVPRCLFNGCTDDGNHVFVQTTTKTLGSKVVHEWNDKMEMFLKELYQATSVKTLFEETDYYSTLQAVRHHAEWLCDAVDKDLYIKVVDDILQRYEGQEVEYGVCHGDFTPWNMFEEGGRLFVFDWEYARLTYPKGLDRYHFMTQTAIFERGMSAEGIIAEMKDASWMDREVYLLYLVDIIARFSLREKGHFNEGMRGCMVIWNALVEWIWQKH